MEKTPNDTSSLLYILFAILLSIWLAGTLLEWFIATQNFRTVDRVLSQESQQLEKQSQPLSHDQLRLLLRHLASELNRYYFVAWGWAQMVLAVILLAMLVRLRIKDSVSWLLIGGMITLVVGLHFIVTPQLVELGRDIDFIPQEPTPPEMIRLGKLHAAFTGLDAVKLVAGIALLVRWNKKHGFQFLVSG